MPLDDDVRALLNTSGQDVLDGFAAAWASFQENADPDESAPVLVLVIGSDRHWMTRTMHPGEDRDRFAELGLLDLVRHILLEDLNDGADLSG